MKSGGKVAVLCIFPARLLLTGSWERTHSWLRPGRALFRRTIWRMAFCRPYRNCMSWRRPGFAAVMRTVPLIYVTYANEDLGVEFALFYVVTIEYDGTTWSVQTEEFGGV